MKKRVLITGGCGFAGHHLVEHLLVTTDWELVLIDSLSYAGRVDRLTDTAGYDPSRVHVLWHDLRAPIRSALDENIGQIEAVLHLAAETHVDRSILDPVSFTQNNFWVTLNLLEWARHRYITHFVQISTDEVYGPAQVGQRHVEWSPILPSNPYAASKAAQEALCIAWWRTYGVPVVITNTMNLFGERQHPEKYIPMTIANVNNDRTVILHGRFVGEAWESSSRHWLHARNHADAQRWIIEETRPTMYDGAHGQLRPDRWNVAGDEYDVEQIAQKIAEVLGKKLTVNRVDFHASRPGHDLRYALDASAIAAAGWKPPIPTMAALEKTVRWSIDNSKWLR